MLFLLVLVPCSNQVVFATGPISQDIKFDIFRTKRALKWNKNNFSLFLTGFQLSKIVSDLTVRRFHTIK